MRVLAFLSIATAAALSGCVVPDAAPRGAGPASVPTAFGSDRAAAPAGALAAWWTAFDDPVLTSLVSRALAENLDVRQAALRVREARLQQRIVRGGQGPQANASTSAMASHLSRNALPSSLANLFSGSSGSGGGLGLPGETIRTYQAGFDASWELDLFGGDARANEAAQARADAALWSRRDAEVVLVAEVASTWLQTRSLRRRLTLADDALATRRDAASSQLLVEALKVHADYADDTRPTSVAAIARATLVTKSREVALALAEFLRRPETDTDTLALISQAIAAAGAVEALPLLRDFVCMYRGEPMYDGDPTALIASATAMLELGGPAERELLLFVAEEPRTVDPLRRHLRRALAAAPAATALGTP